MLRFLSKAKKNELRGTALLRLDFNTEDEWRMRASLSTIKFLLSRGVTVVVLSHRGRPRGLDPKLSLKKDAKVLERLSGKKVRFIAHFRFAEIKRLLAREGAGRLFLLENLRFLKGEEKNDKKLARELASLGDFYVNDAFAVSHRADASTAAITSFLKSYAGLELENELKHLSHIMGRPRRPLVMIFGGGKANTKLPIIRYFEKRADLFVVGGVLSNTILKAWGIGIGKSLADPDPDPSIHRIIEYKNLILPVDYRIKDEMLLDIGPKTVARVGKEVRKARTIIWNGPFGLIEDPRFRKGTLGIARAIAANRKAFSVVGGGETVMLLKKYGLDKKFSFVSTGGGAMLDFLAGKKLPGIEALRKSKK